MQHSKWAPKPGELSWSAEMERNEAEAKEVKPVKKGKTKRGYRSPEAEKRNAAKWPASKQARGGKREEDEQQ